MYARKFKEIYWAGALSLFNVYFLSEQNNRIFQRKTNQSFDTLFFISDGGTCNSFTYVIYVCSTYIVFTISNIYLQQLSYYQVITLDTNSVCRHFINYYRPIDIFFFVKLQH